MKRRKVIPCPTCENGKLYWTEKAICGNCEADLRYGRKIKELLAEQGDKVTEVVLGDGFLHGHRLPESMKERHAAHNLSRKFSLPSLILELTGQLVKKVYNQEYSKGSWYSTGGNDYSVTVPSPIAEKIKLLVDWIGSLVYAAHREGVEEGQNLLMGLANGDVSVEDFNKASMKH